MRSRVSGKSLDPTSPRRADRNRSASRVARSEIGFRRLFETAQDGILILDGETGKVLEVNPCVTQLTGLSREEVIGKELKDLGIPQTQQTCVDRLKKPGSTEVERFEIKWGASGKQPKDLEFVCSGYEESGRRLIQCNVRDIAERRERESQLREALQQLAATKQLLEAKVRERTADLQQRNAELEAFSYSLSHDLRAPIRAIVSFTQIALEDYEEKVGLPATGLLRKAISAAQRLDRLIQDVLAFSKTSHQTVVPRRVDVEKLVREVLQERPEWNPPNVQIEVSNPLLPVVGDGASLTQCLTNLLDNAVKFSTQGGIPRVTIFTIREGSKVRVCVADNGIGIPASAQSRIFELFQRAHNGYEGFGIGLAIVRRAADRMHGKVGFQSEPGKGSTFWVELPAAEEPKQ